MVVARRAPEILIASHGASVLTVHRAEVGRSRAVVATTRFQVIGNPDESEGSEGSPLLALLGPPAVGKTSLTARLAANGISIFRLRDVARSYARVRGEVLRPVPGDRLGWLSDEYVEDVLEFAFTRRGFPNHSRPVVLENFPGNVVQLEALSRIASECNAPLTAIELVASDACLRRRAASRRVCVSCEPDPDGDPHRPAQARSATDDLCERCGSKLLARKQDAPSVFEERLTRYNENMSSIRVRLDQQAVPFLRIDAEAELTRAFDDAQQRLARRGIAKGPTSLISPEERPHG